MLGRCYPVDQFFMDGGDDACGVGHMPEIGNYLSGYLNVYTKKQSNAFDMLKSILLR